RSCLLIRGRTSNSLDAPGGCSTTMTPAEAQPFESLAPANAARIRGVTRPASLLRRPVTFRGPDGRNLAAHLAFLALAVLPFRDAVFGGSILFTRDIGMW